MAEVRSLLLILRLHLKHHNHAETLSFFGKRAEMDIRGSIKAVRDQVQAAEAGLFLRVQG